MSAEVDQTIEMRDGTGKLCGTYHYHDPFKSFFRGLYTPNGVNVVACPPPEHPHHKGALRNLDAISTSIRIQHQANYLLF